jgi:hypothetical protein
MKRQISDLIARESLDAIVCDFLFAASNIAGLSRATLFQHNVEAQIWKRPPRSFLERTRTETTPQPA